MTRPIFAFLLCALSAFAVPWVPATARAAGAEASATAYLSELDDVPLMAGLAEVPDAGVVFETPEGRLIEAEATGLLAPGLDPRAVAAFYRAALPGLGWRLRQDGAFVRAAEELSIRTRTHGRTLSVRFSLKPLGRRR